jgi:hypothetical protein
MPRDPAGGGTAPLSVDNTGEPLSPRSSTEDHVHAPGERQAERRLVPRLEISGSPRSAASLTAAGTQPPSPAFRTPPSAAARLQHLSTEESMGTSPMFRQQPSSAGAAAAAALSGFQQVSRLDLQTAGRYYSSDSEQGSPRSANSAASFDVSFGFLARCPSACTHLTYSNCRRASAWNRCESIFPRCPARCHRASPR